MAQIGGAEGIWKQIPLARDPEYSGRLAVPGAAETSGNDQPLSPHVRMSSFLQVSAQVEDWQSELWHHGSNVGFAVALPVSGPRLPHSAAPCLQESHLPSFPSSGDWKQLEHSHEDATVVCERTGIRAVNLPSASSGLRGVVLDSVR